MSIYAHTYTHTLFRCIHTTFVMLKGKFIITGFLNNNLFSTKQTNTPSQKQQENDISRTNVLFSPSLTFVSVEPFNWCLQITIISVNKPIQKDTVSNFMLKKKVFCYGGIETCNKFHWKIDGFINWDCGCKRQFQSHSSFQ